MGTKANQTKELICAKAYGLFAERGYKDVTMTEICQATGLSRGGLYRHYDSTAAVFQEIIGALMERQGDEFADKIRLEVPAVRILDEVLERYEREMCDSEHSLSLAIYEFFSSPEAKKEGNSIHLQYLASCGMWTRLIRYGVERGEFLNADPQSVFDLIVFTYQGVRMYSKLMPIDPEIPKGITARVRELLVPRALQPETAQSLNAPEALWEGPALLNPRDTVKPVEGFPEVCISTFSKAIIDRYAAMNGVEVIAHLYYAGGEIPVYRISYGGSEFAFYLSLVGAPASVCCLEEVLAMGAKKVVFFGCCGILDDEAVGNRLIVPTGAVRGEGTSAYYISPDTELAPSPEEDRLLRACMERCGYPYAAGKIWTNDAIYRETSRTVSARKRQGCLGVEMEYAALLAAARYRKTPFIQFFYGADSLDSPQWQPRDLTDYGLASADKYMALALECGLAMENL